MPYRLIITIIIFAVFLVFITFNLDNRCDIKFGFYTFNDVPVFITVFISFILGLFCTLPLAIHAIKKHRKHKNISANPPPEDEKIKKDAAEARERFFSKRKKEKPEEDGFTGNE
ncbi:MAG: hypothetical protein FWC19_07810 [Treponema sp.]|nr:hypothetical protein [Treponema sp.]MCL2272687.1 hypothetical protein [Treponema sp.]